jgi:hypothetical protein
VCVYAVKQPPLLVMVVMMIMMLIMSFMQDIYTNIPLKKPCFQGIQCCSYFVITIHGAYNAISSVKSIVLLH